MTSAQSSVAVLLLLGLRGCGWGPNTEIDPPGAASGSASSLETQAGLDSPGPAEGNFNQARLSVWDDRQQVRRAARTSLHQEELTWMTTVQDARIALLVSPETGFDTWGCDTSLAEIPPGWHTGRHSHGEEGIYIISGQGFIAVDGVRYDIFPGTTVGLPFGAEHQLFNTGQDSLRYFSATGYPLERHVGLYRLEQFEERGPTTESPKLPVSEDGYDKEGRRIRLLWEEALYRDGSVGLRAWLEARLRGGVDLRRRHSDDDPGARNQSARLASGIGHHSAWVRLMGVPGQMDFPNILTMISGILIDDPGVYSGRHAHMDAIIYVLSGQGYSVVDGKRIEWRSGTSLHIQGPQTLHQHFNTGDEPAFLLRVDNELRGQLQKAAQDVFPFLWWEAHGKSD